MLVLFLRGPLGSSVVGDSLEDHGLELVCRIEDLEAFHRELDALFDRHATDGRLTFTYRTLVMARPARP